MIKKRFISLCLILMIFVSMLPLGATSASAADELTISYSFTYTNAGYAEGKVNLSGSSDDYGKYYLYWADDSKALDGYSEITTLTLNSSSKSFTFDEFTAIPTGATKLIAIKSDSEPTDKTVTSADAVYTVPESKRFKYSDSEKTYSFQALSDIHIDKQSNVYYTYSDLHFEQALECASDRDVDFVTICGDMINGYENSYVKEWQTYQQIIADSSYCNPIYECSGNHEIKSQLAYGLDTFKTGTGLDTSTSAMRDEPYFEITAENGDHFIFMCLELDDSPNLSDEFTTAQIDWLEGLLSDYHDDGHNIFIYEHALISKYGAGDDKDNPYYGGGLSQSYPAVQELIGLLEQYPDVFFISGHTHLDFKYGYNIDNKDGTTAYTVHIPATTSTTKISNGSMDYTMSKDSSQGYFVDVYGDCVIFNGTDLTKNTIYPAYTYIVDQTDKKPSGGGDDDTTDKFSVTVDVSNVSSNPDTVYCYTFDSTGTLTPKSNKMTVNSDGTFSANVSDEYDKMYFVINDSVLGKIGTNNYDVNNCLVVIGSEKITYDAPSAWGSSVYAYVWSDSNQLFSWPGIKMTLDSATGDYYAYIPDNTYTYIIFNNGDGTQTDDLSITPYVSDGTTGSYTVIEKYKLGDANLDGNIDISDATLISKANAKIVTLTDEQKIYADTSGDGEINISDATYIQKYLVELITSLPEVTIQNTDTVLLTSSTETSLDTLLESAKALLDEDYRYASFDAYMALKKAYYRFFESDINSSDSEEYEVAYKALETAIADFNTLKTNNNIITVYFTDNRSWGSANAYVWDASGNNLQKWGGQPMTYIEKNSMSQSIYAITLNQSVWKNIIFNNNSSQTVDITLSSTHRTGYYLSTQSSGKYTVKTYSY